MKLLARLLSVLAIVLFMTMSAGMIAGCAHTAAGLTREQSAEDAATNAVAFVARYIAPMVPAPYNGILPFALGCVGAALGAWHLSLSKRSAAQVPPASPTR
jgi:hypothetical protein